MHYCIRAMALATALATSGPAHAADATRPTMAANPERVCADSGDLAYLNFDLIIRNPGAEPLKISELRAVVLDARGQMIERRLIWQQSLALLAPDRDVPAKGEALIFNPLLLRSGAAGTSVRLEVEFEGHKPGTAPLSLTVTPQDCTSPVAMISPIAGRLLVYDGYDVYSHHRRTGYGGSEDAALGLTDNFQRFGIDLVAIDGQGRFFTGDGQTTGQWLGWGRPVRSVAAGTVAAVHDGQPDNVVIGTVDRWTERDLAKNPMTSYGNYVLIDHGQGEFTLSAHLQNGSVKVRKGQQVAAGAPIGAIGNSGASGGVHLHFERRSGPGIAGIRTLPPTFQGVEALSRGLAQPSGALAPDSGDVFVAR